MSALHRKLLRDLWRLRSQVLAVALVMASGIGLLIMSLAVIEALGETMTAYYERNQFAHVFASVTRAPERLTARVQALPGVRHVTSRVTELATVDVPGYPDPVVARLMSVPARAAPTQNALTIRAGRYLTPGRRDEVLVNEPFARAHGLRAGDSLRVVMNGRQRKLSVVGIALSPEFVYTIGPGALMPDDHRFGVLWLARDALEAAFDFEGAFNDLSVSLLPGVDADGVVAEMDRILSRYGGRGAYARADHLSHWFVVNEVAQLRNIATILPSIFLAVAAYLVFMVLDRVVATERGEIGLLKAFGYRDGTIAVHYLMFASAIVAVGVGIGWPVGYGLGRLSTSIYAAHYHFPFLVYRPSAEPFLVGAGVCLATALAGAFGAVRRAARLAPAEAMQPPAPPAFHGRDRWLSRQLGRHDQLTAIIFRQLSRWWLRAGFTVLGLSMAVALAVLALQWPDAIESIAETTFFRDQRQDATVILAEPRARDAVHDLAHLPGVSAVEPLRSAEARVRFGHRERRVAIEGFARPSRMEVVRDASGRIVEMPDAGLAMARKLADVLGVQAGDVVRVEFLEGRQRTLDVPVAGVFEGFVGTRALMRIDALGRALGDGPSLRAAHLHVEPGRLDDLLQRLKTVPMVQAVIVRLNAVRLFNETLARTVNVYVGFYLAFSCVLAFGIAYNSARVALSERGHEIATLRVLGFDRRDASYVLLGELGALLAVALPFGCALGHALSVMLASAFETELFRIPVRIRDATYGASVCIVLVAAVVSAVLVHRQVLALELTVALKSRQ